MGARENILARIRARQGKDAIAAASEREAVRTYLAAPARHPRPPLEGDLRACFRERAVALASTVEEVAALAEAPAAVARYLETHRLPPVAVCWPQLAGLEWSGAGLRVEARAAHESDSVGITGAFCAIAETGTLMTVSGPDTPAVTSLLPETHIALVRASRIVRGMEEAWALARAELGALARAVNFISGPSRSADLEQTVTLGAHGPYRVHIVLVAGA